MTPRVLVLGFAGLAPELVLGRYRDRCPTLAGLQDAGAFGPLAGVAPPGAVPGFAALLSGQEPARLGVYGVRHRVLGRYDARYLARGDHPTGARVCDHLGAAGLRSGLLGVPDSFPPRPLEGWSVAGLLAADGADYTYPPALREEVEDLLGDYHPDPFDCHVVDEERVRAAVRLGSQRRFALLRHLLRRHPTDLTVLCEPGPARLQRVSWRHADPEHARHDPRHPQADAVADYYAELDEEIGRTLHRVPPECHVLVVSVHGARPLAGAFRLNEWLRREGLLTLRAAPSGPTPFAEDLVDFARTRAWAWGGAHGRVFVNLAGREPAGAVAPAALDGFLADLAARLGAVTAPGGGPIGRVLRPRDLGAGAAPAGDYPDLLVLPGERAVHLDATVGEAELFGPAPADAAPDGAGLLVYRGPRVTRPGPRAGLRLVDVAPTILDLLGLPPPADAAGRPLTFD